MIIFITLYNRYFIIWSSCLSSFFSGIYFIDVNILTQIQIVLFPYSQPSNIPEKAWNKSQSPYNDLRELYGLTFSPCSVIYSAPVVFTFSLFLEHTSHIFIFIGSSFSLKLSFIGGYCLTLLSF